MTLYEVKLRHTDQQGTQTETMTVEADSKKQADLYATNYSKLGRDGTISVQHIREV